MRIVAGKARGTRLQTPVNQQIRPTSDRVRQAVFNILEHGIEGVQLKGTRVLDLFSGTGALGLEALSRGAAFCVFIDMDATARGLVRANVERAHMTGQCRISPRDACNLGPIGKYQPFDLVFADPPYGRGLAEKAAVSVIQGAWLNQGALMVAEEANNAQFDWPDGFSALDERRYGDTLVRFARAD